MMHGSGDLFSSMVGLDFVVYRLQQRATRTHPNQHGPWGVRLGPKASGELSQQLRAPTKMPPATRKASPREVIQFLRNPLQIGYPATMITDACLGFCVMAYQA